MLPKYALVAIATAIILVGAAVLVATNTHPTEVTSTTSSSNSGTHSTQLFPHAALVLSLNPTTRLVAEDVNSTFTLNLYDFGNLTGRANLAVVGPPGLAVFLDPDSIALNGGDNAVDVKVTANPSIPLGQYQKTIVATLTSGSFNETFRFTVVANLVNILPSGGAVNPEVLTVKSGSMVTWFNADAGTEDATDAHMLVFQGTNISSPVLHTGDRWGYVFSKPGLYPYSDGIGGVPLGELVVTG